MLLGHEVCPPCGNGWGPLENNHRAESLHVARAAGDGGPQPIAGVTSYSFRESEVCSPLCPQVPEEVRLGDAGSCSPPGTRPRLLAWGVPGGLGRAGGWGHPGEVAQVPGPAGPSSGPGLWGVPAGHGSALGGRRVVWDAGGSPRSPAVPPKTSLKGKVSPRTV